MNFNITAQMPNVQRSVKVRMVGLITTRIIRLLRLYLFWSADLQHMVCNSTYYF